MKVLFLSTKTGEGEGIEQEFSIPFWRDIFKLNLTFKHLCVCVDWIWIWIALTLLFQQILDLYWQSKFLELIFSELILIFHNKLKFIVCDWICYPKNGLNHGLSCCNSLVHCYLTFFSCHGTARKILINWRNLNVKNWTI